VIGDRNGWVSDSLRSGTEHRPYSLVEIQDYLFANHYRYALREEPTTFDVSGPHAQRQDAETRYWLFEAHDNTTHRQWFVVVGTGKSPWNRYQRMKRWMYGETNDGDLSPDQFLDEVWREHLAEGARSR
jgi:hypothetical protein